MSDNSKFEEMHKQLFDEGVKVRRAVLGDEYVNNALQNATPFTMPGQQLITEWAWGTVWQRPGLDRKQRSLLSKSNSSIIPRDREPEVANIYWGYSIDIGIIIAQKAWLELALHTRGAINNGLTEIEIREAVLQATVYCGTPAGVEAMMVTEKTINEMVEKGEYKRPEV
jgi:4-carboxymuconolactone decarboxylase